MLGTTEAYIYPPSSLQLNTPLFTPFLLYSISPQIQNPNFFTHNLQNPRMKRLRVPSCSDTSDDDRVLNPRTAAGGAASFPPTPNSTVPPFTTRQMELQVYQGGVSAVPEAAAEENGTKNFLERCFLCKKRLNHNNEVYMYGNFQAFCTPECRAKQIDIDSKMEKVCNQSGGTRGESSRKNNDQSGPGPVPVKRPPAQFHI